METGETATYRVIRKLRKKLRQIEHLESLERDLNDEELRKCLKKDAIREELHELLSEFGNDSHVTSTYSTIDSSAVSWSSALGDTVFPGSPALEDEANTSRSSHYQLQPKELLEKENEQSQEQSWQSAGGQHQNLNENAGNSREQTAGIQLTDGEGNTKSYGCGDSGSGVETNKDKQTDQQNPTQRSQSPERDKTSEFKIPAPSPPKKSKKAQKDKSPTESAILKQWRSSGFLVTALESHNDIITAVDCDETLIVSASRDTTVKVWDEASLTELRSLGSHTGSVTDVVLLSRKQYGSLGEKLGLGEDDKLILSSSMDCSIKMWSANTGELLRSLYTYNPITKIAFLQDLSLVISTSDGGKLELWDLDTKQTVCSELAHENSITALCHDNQRIYTASTDNVIKIHEIREQSLKCVYVSENVRSLAGQPVSLRRVKSLAVKGDVLFCGDDGVNIKVLDWKKGLVKKLPNHKEDYGMTDAICCHKDLLYTSAYDLDTGQGYINVFDVTSSPSYITSVDDEDTGRIFDIACCQAGSRAVTMVTAGTELKVWKQVPSADDIEIIIPTKVIPRLSQSAVDSDIESDAEFTDTDSEDNADAGRRGSRRGSLSQTGGWRSWCSLT